MYYTLGVELDRRATRARGARCRRWRATFGFGRMTEHRSARRAGGPRPGRRVEVEPASRTRRPSTAGGSPVTRRTSRSVRASCRRRRCSSPSAYARDRQPRHGVPAARPEVSRAAGRVATDRRRRRVPDGHRAEVGRRRRCFERVDIAPGALALHRGLDEGDGARGRHGGGRVLRLPARPGRRRRQVGHGADEAEAVVRVVRGDRARPATRRSSSSRSSKRRGAARRSPRRSCGR